MVGVLKRLLPVVPLLAAVGTASGDEPDRFRVRTGVDAAFVSTDGLTSWTGGSLGKLRYDDATDGLVLSRAFVDYRHLLADTLDANVALEFYDDDLGSFGDFTEAYLEWRPVPRSANRYRLKVGAFYPRISFENVGPGWSNPYTTSSSAINTWVAEELRTFGAELSVSRRPESLGGAHTFSLYGAAFVNNDPAGALLAWRGWSLHERQTRFDDELPLAPLPQLEPDGYFRAQEQYVAPFREIDGRAGYYLNGEWQLRGRVAVRLMHYDNRADPTAIEEGQYAWYTEFDHIGAQLALPADMGVILQWMRGSTVMGGIYNGTHAVDCEFDSKFMLLTRTIGDHRLSMRVDLFEVEQYDTTREDDNPEHGNALTLAWQYQHTDRVTLAAEYLRVHSFRNALMYLGLEPDRTDQQLLLSLRLRLGN